MCTAHCAAVSIFSTDQTAERYTDQVIFDPCAIILKLTLITLLCMYRGVPLYKLEFIPNSKTCFASQEAYLPPVLDQHVTPPLRDSIPNHHGEVSLYSRSFHRHTSIHPTNPSPVSSIPAAHSHPSPLSVLYNSIPAFPATQFVPVPPPVFAIVPLASHSGQTLHSIHSPLPLRHSNLSYSRTTASARCRARKTSISFRYASCKQHITNRYPYLILRLFPDICRAIRYPRPRSPSNPATSAVAIMHHTFYPHVPTANAERAPSKTRARCHPSRRVLYKRQGRVAFQIHAQLAIGTR